MTGIQRGYHLPVNSDQSETTGSTVWARMGWMVLGLTLLAVPAVGQSVPQSWTADRRDFAEGDVITVIIDEFTSASSNQGDFASDRRYRDLGVGASQTMAPMPAVGADVSTSNQA